MLWPFLGGVARLLAAAGGGWLLARQGGSMAEVFVMVACGSVAFGTLNCIGMGLAARGMKAGPLAG